MLIISMGGERRDVLENMFATPLLRDHFEPPTVVPGIPARELRNRATFLRHCQAAGLLPDAEWAALQSTLADPRCSAPTSASTPNLWECLRDVPVTTGRRGSDYDVSLHYTEELWRKAKTVNRGRAVLACALAHLTALRTLVNDDFDVLLEDNVRMPVESVVERVWDIIDATKTAAEQASCHMRYFGWLGSIPNLQWIYTSHIASSGGATVVPCPTPQDIDADSEVRVENEEEDESRVALESSPENKAQKTNDSNGRKEAKDLTKPGGNPVWGTYAYWISKDAYEVILNTLRNDVGALLWKSKRMRYYHVKPIDKIVPRGIRAAFGTASVMISARPALFRAPMLTSKIHTQWDPEFCKSTAYQLHQSGLSWLDLALTATEQRVVAHADAHPGEWLTPAQLNGSTDDAGDRGNNDEHIADLVCERDASHGEKIVRSYEP